MTRVLHSYLYLRVHWSRRGCSWRPRKSAARTSSSARSDTNWTDEDTVCSIKIACPILQSLFHIFVFKSTKYSLKFCILNYGWRLCMLCSMSNIKSFSLPFRSARSGRCCVCWTSWPACLPIASTRAPQTHPILKAIIILSRAFIFLSVYKKKGYQRSGLFIKKMYLQSKCLFVEFKDLRKKFHTSSKQQICVNHPYNGIKFLKIQEYSQATQWWQ